MLEKTLARLVAAGHEPIPAAELARHSGVPAGEIDRQVRELSELGYVIEQHPHHGYRLEHAPDRLIPEDLRGRLLAALEGRAPEPAIGRRILVFETTASTNDLVRRMGGEGQPEGLVVFAESQTAGRGRHRRKWVSPPRRGLWFSLLLRPGIGIQALPRLTVMAVVAIVSALRRATHLPLRIKWPNDVLCRGRKLAGILVEAETRGSQVRHAVIGIGINVNLDPDDFDAALRQTATSLKIEAGRSFHRPSLAAEILLELDRLHGSVAADRFPALLEQWVELDQTLGSQVRWREQGHEIRGHAVGLDGDGALVVRTDDGRTASLSAGDVEFDKAADGE